MADISSEAIRAARNELGVDEAHIPTSVAVIMDGNGRWARAHGLPRTTGHMEGSKVVRKIVTESARLGLSSLTLYSFSIQNWRRPTNEVEALMHLHAETLRRERPMLMDHNIRMRHLGRREGLPEIVLRELDESLRASASNTGMYLNLAINYASRAEITDAVVRIAKRVAAGKLDADDINESTISDSLDTAGVPDPDLLIRTSGEMRLSNYLLWQLSYAEFYVTDVHWPDFDEEDFRRAIKAYAERNRRFGGIDDSNT
ncbi:MAG: isoprenyl transferase [Planctomycetes bacterium]|nr:isoprenyl transferase [Planctomycetota bacterium]